MNVFTAEDLHMAATSAYQAGLDAYDDAMDQLWKLAGGNDSPVYKLFLGFRDSFAATVAAAQEAVDFYVCDHCGHHYMDDGVNCDCIPSSTARPLRHVRMAPVAAAPADLTNWAAHYSINPAAVEALQSMLTSTSAGPGIDLGKLELWFFRELSSEQRMALFSIFGLPVDEIGESHVNQKLMLRHVLKADASPKGGSDEASIPEPHQECYSDDGGDSWHEHPADAELVEGLAVGDTYTLTVSHYSVERTYRVIKAPDETSDDYEVEPVQATSAEVGS